MEIKYKIGGRTTKLGELSIGNLFYYPDSDSLFLLTTGNLDSKEEVVDIESGFRYKYNADLDVIKVKGRMEVQPITN